MKKLIVITLIVLLAAMAVAVPAIADNSDSAHACARLKSALSQMDKGDPAFPILWDVFNEHCGKPEGGGSANACDGIRNALFNAGKDSPAHAALEYQMKLHCSGGVENQ